MRYLSICVAVLVTARAQERITGFQDTPVIDDYLRALSSAWSRFAYDDAYLEIPLWFSESVPILLDALSQAIPEMRAGYESWKQAVDR